MDSKRWVMRWWPLLYSFVWAMWAILAPEPYIGNYKMLGHLVAAIGAIGLFMMALRPDKKYVRFFGTLAAIIYPLHRALSIAVDPDSFTTMSRRVTAIGFSLIVVLSLLVMYPALWWVTKNRGPLDE